MDGSSSSSSASLSEAVTQLSDMAADRKARVEAVWDQMNKGTPLKSFKAPPPPSLNINKKNPSASKTSKSSSNWMTALGLAPSRTPPIANNALHKQSNITSTPEVKAIAAAALAAVKNASAAAAAAKGKMIEITEMKDFAGQQIEVKKVVDADSKEASEMAKASAGPSSAVDAVLEHIKKKQKLSVLDKTKKDWGEYKGENKGLEDELDAYKKSSNQYLDKVSFLQRADYREFERERDVRLGLQSRKNLDMRDDLD